MKNILFSSLVAVSLMVISAGCYGEKVATNTATKVSKSACASCVDGKKCDKCVAKKMKCGAGKCGGGK